MNPGRELDDEVARKVMGMTTAWGYFSEDVYAKELEGKPVPKYSTDIAAAWEIVSKLAPIVGDFHEADGFFILQYADSASHSCDDCDPGEGETDADDNDLSKWSAHFHPGHPGADTESAKMFPDYNKHCARGRTAAHAICIAALKALTHPARPA